MKRMNSSTPQTVATPHWNISSTNGFVTEGGADNPIDMTKEDEIEDEMSELVGGAEDLITNGHFIDIPEADMMMMDEIGSFDGTASFTIDGDLL